MESDGIKAEERKAEENRKLLRALDRLSEEDKLLEIWKVLEALTVSLERIGWYWHFHGEEAGKEAGKEAAKEELIRYLGPEMNEQIARARYLAVGLLEGHNRAIMTRLEKMAESGTEINYWNGPSTDQT
jgi:hypothetical protein